jgi:hypothetical protein
MDTAEMTRLVVIFTVLTSSPNSLSRGLIVEGHTTNRLIVDYWEQLTAGVAGR